MTPSVFIIAGEASGDRHGALLIRHLKAFDPELTFFGIGGPRMEAEGLYSLFSIGQMAVTGFVEVIRHIKFFKTVEQKVLLTISEKKPVRIILIDYPGFNLRIARKIHKRFRIPVTYYISPQIWAWKSGRIEIIRECVQQMLVIFPFEKAWYHDRGIEVEFVGHPLLDEWDSTDRRELCSTLGLSPDRPVLTLYPGSRKNEIRRHISILIEAAVLLRKSIGDLQVIIGAAPGFAESLPGDFSIPDFIIVETRHPRKSLEAAHAAIIASGTSTIEAAVFGTPMTVVYKMNTLSWMLTRLLVKVPFAGMVNIMAGESIVPEFLQKDADAKRISRSVLRYFQDPEYTETVRAKLKKVRESFGAPGASRRAAGAVITAMREISK